LDWLHFYKWLVQCFDVQCRRHIRAAQASTFQCQTGTAAARTTGFSTIGRLNRRRQEAVAHATGLPRMRTETALPGWAYRTRTGESDRGSSDWFCATIRSEMTLSGWRRSFARQLRDAHLQLGQNFWQAIFKPVADSILSI
jgi:hypothetical protein